MNGSRQRNYLRLLVLVTFIINLEITLLQSRWFRSVETATVRELLVRDEPRVSRLVYYLVSSTYQPDKVIMSREAELLVNGEIPWEGRTSVIGEVEVVEQGTIEGKAPRPLDGLTSSEYKLGNGMTLTLVEAADDEIVDIVYAIVRGNTIWFFPAPRGSD